MTVATRAAGLIDGAVRGMSSPVIAGIAAFNREPKGTEARIMRS